MRRASVSLAVCFMLIVSAGIANASTPDSQTTIATHAQSWLSNQVSSGGYIISPYTSQPSPAMTAQAVVALVGASGNKEIVDSMMSYLKSNVDAFVAPGGSADLPGSLAWLILDAVATGNDPTSFGGVDLVARLQATQQPSGLFGTADATYDGAFRQSLSLIALHAVGSSNASGLAWLVGQQCADGGYVAYRTDTSVACPAVDAATYSGEDTSSTSMAAIALNELGSTAAALHATDWLKSVRTAQGGFPYLGDPTIAMNANSTGLVLLALTTVTGVNDAQAVSALGTLQVPQSSDATDRGGIAFQPQGSTLVPDIMATTQALMGLAGKPFPFRPVVVPSTTTTVAPTPSVTVPSTLPRVPSTTAPATAAPATAQTATPTYTG